MTELAEILPSSKDPVNKKRKKRAKKAAPPKPVAGEYAGVSATECCAACTAERCVITTVGVCGHPFKGSLPTAGPKTTLRMEQVRKLLKHQQIDLRG